MNQIIDQSTDTQALVGQTLYTEHFGPFEVLGASQAPEMRAVAYMARDKRDGYPFFAFLPWGKEFIQA